MIFDISAMMMKYRKHKSRLCINDKYILTSLTTTLHFVVALVKRIFIFTFKHRYNRLTNLTSFNDCSWMESRMLCCSLKIQVSNTFIESPFVCLTFSG